MFKQVNAGKAHSQVMAETEKIFKIFLLEGPSLQMGPEVIRSSPFVLGMEKQTQTEEGARLVYLGS